LRPLLVKEGDTVLLPEYGGSKVVLGDEKEYYVYRDDDILGTLSEPTK
jgi:chaperonin GroES